MNEERKNGISMHSYRIEYKIILGSKQIQSNQD